MRVQDTCVHWLVVLWQHWNTYILMSLIKLLKKKGLQMRHENSDNSCAANVQRKEPLTKDILVLGTVRSFSLLDLRQWEGWQMLRTDERHEGSVTSAAESKSGQLVLSIWKVASEVQTTKEDMIFFSIFFFFFFFCFVFWKPNFIKLCGFLKVIKLFRWEANKNLSSWGSSKWTMQQSGG